MCWCVKAVIFERLEKAYRDNVNKSCTPCSILVFKLLYLSTISLSSFANHKIYTTVCYKVWRMSQWQTITALLNLKTEW